MEQLPYLLAVVGVLLLVCLLRQIPYRKRRGPTLTGYATVLSRRVEYERGYEYYVLSPWAEWSRNARSASTAMPSWQKAPRAS